MAWYLIDDEDRDIVEGDPVILSERERLERDIVTHARAYVRAHEAPNVSSLRHYIKLAQSIAELARHEERNEQ